MTESLSMEHELQHGNKMKDDVLRRSVLSYAVQ